MARTRLTDAERVERKRANVSKYLNSFRTYDDRTGYGSIEDWIRTAEKAFSAVIMVTHDETLTVLGLVEMPDSEEALRRAYLVAIKKTHPDLGGSLVEAQKVVQAYQLLRKKVTS